MYTTSFPFVTIIKYTYVCITIIIYKKKCIRAPMPSNNFENPPRKLQLIVYKDFNSITTKPQNKWPFHHFIWFIYSVLWDFATENWALYGNQNIECYLSSNICFSFLHFFYKYKKLLILAVFWKTFTFLFLLAKTAKYCHFLFKYPI